MPVEAVEQTDGMTMQLVKRGLRGRIRGIPVQQDLFWSADAHFIPNLMSSRRIERAMYWTKLPSILVRFRKANLKFLGKTKITDSDPT